jgi:phytoene dehydrogenase-like protein
MANTTYDAIVVGSGPNGLTAAITLAKANLSVLVVEAKETIGGGARTEEITLPGYHHDICSAIHPIGAISPAFRELNLAGRGIEWLHAPLALAHPLDDGTAAALHVSVEETARSLGGDGDAWRELMGPYVESGLTLFEETLKPIRVPRHPFLMARFGLAGLRSCDSLVSARFREQKARALFAGCAAHGILPLDAAATASFGLMLALSGHAVGWPCIRGGSVRIVEALATMLRELGGEIRTGTEVRSLHDLPASRVVLFDLTPRQVARIAGDDLPDGYRRKLERFRYGPGIFKIDWALDGPIPWKAAECGLATTVHVGGTYEEVAAAERAVADGSIPERPFVLMAQQSSVDPTRAPAGKHTGWAYCHVPNGSTVDMTGRIEQQIERFAPGFGDLILARRTMNTRDVEAHNPNMIGGDIGGGMNNIMQFIFRPFFRLDPYSTPNERLFVCSSSTPPGGGVHGMCGYWGARSALRKRFGR